MTLCLSLGILVENFSESQDADGATDVAQGHLLLRLGDEPQGISVAEVAHGLQELGGVADALREGTPQ